MMWRDHLFDLLERCFGIAITTDVAGSVERFVERRRAALALGEASIYVAMLEDGSRNADELARIAAVITTGHTWFNRDEEQLAITTRLLSALAAKRRRPLQIWCAGCSSGEEAYTLAIACSEAAIDADIVASDLNADAVGIAEKATYARWALRHLPTAALERHFRSAPSGYRLVDAIRARVSFKTHNLLDAPLRPSPPATTWDAIACRNVLVHCSPRGNAAITARLASVVAPDGWIVLGAADALRAAALRTTSVDGRIFHRSTATAEPDPPPPPAAPLPPASPDVVADEPIADARSWLEVGHRALSAHDFESALNAYASARTHDPFLAEVHFAEGVLLLKSGEPHGAAEALRRALFLDPDFWPASFLQAGAWARLGAAHLSRAAYARARASIDRRPDSPFASPLAARVFRLPVGEVRDTCERELAAPISASRGLGRRRD